MAKGNPLQEQLLKAGLVKKSKLAEVAREQHKARHGKGAPAPSEIQREAERARAEKVERDRALEAERKAQARAIGADATGGERAGGQACNGDETRALSKEPQKS